MKKLGLNPDEIRIKLDQIMEWKELLSKTNKCDYIDYDYRNRHRV